MSKIKTKNKLLFMVVITVAVVLCAATVGMSSESPQFLPLENVSSISSTGDGAMFQPLTTAEFTETIASDHDTHHTSGSMTTPLIALILTVTAALFVRFRKTRHLRSLFLLGSLIFFGFINGGCPCVVGSFLNVLLTGLGDGFHIQGLVWFGGVVILTYLFGRIWCGWVCHLGALQEFIYRKNSLTFLTGVRAQRVLRWMRYVFFFALVGQLLVTRTNLFKEIDPFAVAFNFISPYPMGWVLLGLLLVTSVLIYRPFCRGVCPVGLVLGLVAKLPGALSLRSNSSCNGCRRCEKTCASEAIEGTTVSASDCIMCGNCLDTCTRKGYDFVRNPFPVREREKKDTTLVYPA